MTVCYEPVTGAHVGPGTALEVGKVVHGEKLAHMGSARKELLFDLLKALPLFDHPRRLHHLHPLAERGGVEGAQALLALLREKGYQVQGAVILFSPAHEKGQGRAARGRQYRPHGRRPE